MADITDLAQKLAFYRSGGKDEGQRDIDKIGKIFGTVKGGIDYRDEIIKRTLAEKKTQLENQKLNRDITPIQTTAGAGNPLPSGVPQSFANFTPDEAQKMATFDKTDDRSPVVADQTTETLTGGKIKAGTITTTGMVKLYAAQGRAETAAEAAAGRMEQSQQFRRSKDVLDYTQQMENNPLLKKLKEQNLGIGQVQEMLDLVKKGNTVASSAAGVKMAKAMGEVGVLTENDVGRYVTSGKLSQSSGDKLSRWLTGTPSDATQQEISEIAGVLQDSLNSKLQPIYADYTNRLSRNYNVPPEKAAFLMSVPYSPPNKPIKKVTNNKPLAVDSSTARVEAALNDVKIPQPLKEQIKMLRGQGFTDAEIVASESFSGGK